jgi:hypothetical protein
MLDHSSACFALQKGHNSNVEFTAHILEQVLAGELKITGAVAKLGVTPRQVYRVRERLISRGLEGLQQRGKDRPGAAGIRWSSSLNLGVWHESTSTDQKGCSLSRDTGQITEPALH